MKQLNKIDTLYEWYISKITQSPASTLAIATHFPS